MNRKYIKYFNVLIVSIVFTFGFGLKAQNGWYPLQSGTSNVLKSIFFVNSNIGYMAGNAIILKTLDAGRNWLVITNSFSGSSIYFNDQYTGYICEGTIYKTTNGGINFVDLNQTSLNSVYFVDKNTGFGVGVNSKIIKTTNAGVSWDIQFVSVYENKFNSVYFINPNTGFIAGGRMHDPYSGIIFKTVNGGLSWYEVSPTTADIDFRSIVFPSVNIGYAVGGYEFGSSGVIFKTTNCGETWTQQGIVNKDLNSVHFWNDNIGYAVGEDGIILKTTNGSAIWNAQQSSTFDDLLSVYFVESNLGFTSGKSGSVQKTQNGGVLEPPFAIAGRVTTPNGQAVTRGMVKALKYDRASNTVVVVDTASIQINGDYILRNVPVDSVDIMAYPNDEDEESPMPPKFVPTYYAGNNVGTISWSVSNTLYANNNLFNINIRVFNITGSGGNGYIGGGVYVAPPETGGLQNAIVYAMVGNEFKGFSISKSNALYDVNNLAQADYRMICDRMGYRQAEKFVSLGSFNPDTINFYMTSVNVIGIQQIGTTIPVSFSVQQNYPNPFNPNTKIKFDIPKFSNVKIIVYDMLGRAVENILEGQLQPGTYQVDWNASKFASGIYFYRLIAGDFTNTKKMILVK